MAESAEQDTSNSIEHLGKLLESSNINDKSTAITTLSHLINNKQMIKSMFENQIHLTLMRLLHPFKNTKDEEDCIEGEEDEPDSSKLEPKLSPQLVNELLQILITLASDDDFFDGSIPSESFKRVINILKDEKYKTICQINVYSLIESATEIEPEVLCNVIDDIELKLPKDDDAINVFLRLLARLTEDMEEFDAEFPDKMIKSKLLDELIPITQNNDNKTNGLSQINCYDILWNMCHSHVMYYDLYGEDDDDDNNEEKNEEAKKKMSKEEKDKIYNWVGKYNDSFCEFILKCVSKETCENIVKAINELRNDITKGMDGKWGDKNKNNNKKTIDSVVANNEDLEKWTKQKNIIIDQINKVLITIHLYLKVFESEDVMLPKDESKEDEQEDEEEEQEPDEEEQRRQKKTILTTGSRNQVCGLVIDNWLIREIDVSKLDKLGECVGIDFKYEIGELIRQLKIEQISFLGSLISGAIVSLSSSQWQRLWDFGCKNIVDDNNKSKEQIAKRQKKMEEDNKEDEDNELEEIDGGGSYEQILKVMKYCVKESYKELNVTSLNIENILKLHSRIRNCQEMRMKFDIKNFCKTEDFMPVDLLSVNDMNGYNHDINNILVSLFKMEAVEKSVDNQRLILNGLYEDVEVLCQNIEFIDVLMKYHKEQQGNDDKNKNKKDDNEDEDDDEKQKWYDLLYEWGGNDSIQIGFETTQMVLDIMEKDTYAKLPLNKKKFEGILKRYKIVEEKWNGMKGMVDETNEKIKKDNEKLKDKNKKKKKKKKSRSKNKKKKKDEDNEEDNEEEDESESESSDDGYGFQNVVEWESIDTIGTPIKECIVNIEKFLESQK